MSIMRKRTIAIIAAALCIIILGFSLAAVLEYVSIIEYEDVDGIKYYAKKDGDVYRLYAKKAKEPLALDEKYNQYYRRSKGSDTALMKYVVPQSLVGAWPSVNVTTPETLRKVLADPQKYAPSGVYIMRIHGTFVNFLDLSPEIQQDIITRLDLKSTGIGC